MIKTMRRLFLVFKLFSCYVLCTSLVFAEREVKLQDDMALEAFEKAGLDKLDAEELAYLNAWLSGRIEQEKARVVESIVPGGDNRFGADPEIMRNVERIVPEPKAITSRIIGTFRGWRGNTTFVLENGQTWQQTDKDKFAVNVESPVVTIEKGAFGAYFLKIEGYNSRAKVKRILP